MSLSPPRNFLERDSKPPLLMVGVRDFADLRPKNRQIHIHFLWRSRALNNRSVVSLAAQIVSSDFKHPCQQSTKTETYEEQE